MSASRVLSAAALALALAASTAPVSAASSCRAEVVDLGTLPGGSTSWGLAHAAGQTAGMSGDATGAMRAVRWSHGRIEDLGVPRTGDALALDVNRAGVFVGWYGSTPDPTTQRAFAWYRGRLVTLPAPHGRGAGAWRLNDTGLIVGFTADATGARRPALWIFGRFVDLGLPPGYTSAWAKDVNNAGEIIGDATKGGVAMGFRWRLGRFEMLRGPGGASSGANAIGQRGDVAGVSPPMPTDVGPQAVLWERSQEPRALGFLPGGSGSTLIATDGHGGYGGFSTISPEPTSQRPIVTHADGPLMMLPGLPGTAGRAAIRGMDREGNAVGLATTAAGADHAAFWRCVWHQAVEPSA